MFTLKILLLIALNANMHVKLVNLIMIIVQNVQIVQEKVYLNAIVLVVIMILEILHVDLIVIILQIIVQ